MKIIITESQKRMLIESMDSDSFVVEKVPNKGYGIILKKDYKDGEEIGKLISKTPNKIGRKIKRTAYETDVLGRYSNHSFNPNAKFDKRDGEVYVVANKDIKNGDELTIHYGDLEKLLGVREGMFLTDDFQD